MPETTVPGGDTSVVRASAVIGLLLLSTVALRGHLPGAQRRVEPDDVPGSHPGSLAAVVAMLAVSVAVIAIATISQARRRTAGAPAGEQRRERGWERGPLPWRKLLLVAAALLAWTVLILLLMRVLPDFGAGSPPDAASADPAAPPDAADPDAAGTDAPPPDTGPGNGATVFAILAGATFVFVVLSVLATVRSRRRSPGSAQAFAGEGADTAGPGGGSDLARAAELGLAEMGDLSRDPRAAIIACYAAMERELEKSPGTFPQDSDTPAEVLARAIEHQALPAAHATVLVELFEEARFSPHVMNEGHRADAMSALQAVQRDLQGAT